MLVAGRVAAKARVPKLLSEESTRQRTGVGICFVDGVQLEYCKPSFDDNCDLMAMVEGLLRNRILAYSNISLLTLSAYVLPPSFPVKHLRGQRLLDWSIGAL